MNPPKVPGNLGIQGTESVLEHRAAHGKVSGCVQKGLWSVVVSMVAACGNH